MASRAFRVLLEPERPEDEEQALHREAAVLMLGCLYVNVAMLFNRVDVWHQEWRKAHSK